jgi:hypothetical protein
MSRMAQTRRFKARKYVDDVAHLGSKPTTRTWIPIHDYDRPLSIQITKSYTHDVFYKGNFTTRAFSGTEMPECEEVVCDGV